MLCGISPFFYGFPNRSLIYLYFIGHSSHQDEYNADAHLAPCLEQRISQLSTSFIEPHTTSDLTANSFLSILLSWTNILLMYLNTFYLY